MLTFSEQSILEDEYIHSKKSVGTSLVVQWVRLRIPNAGDPGSIPGGGIRPHMHAATKTRHSQSK